MNKIYLTKLTIEESAIKDVNTISEIVKKLNNIINKHDQTGIEVVDIIGTYETLDSKKDIVGYNIETNESTGKVQIRNLHGK